MKEFLRGVPDALLAPWPLAVWQSLFAWYGVAAIVHLGFSLSIGPAGLSVAVPWSHLVTMAICAVGGWVSRFADEEDAQ